MNLVRVVLQHHRTVLILAWARLLIAHSILASQLATALIGRLLKRRSPQCRFRKMSCDTLRVCLPCSGYEVDLLLKKDLLIAVCL